MIFVIAYFHTNNLDTPIQIPFLSCAGLAWTFILSTYAGSAKSYSPEEELEMQECAMESSDNTNDSGIASERIAAVRS